MSNEGNILTLEDLQGNLAGLLSQYFALLQGANNINLQTIQDQQSLNHNIISTALNDLLGGLSSAISQQTLDINQSTSTSLGTMFLKHETQLNEFRDQMNSNSINTNAKIDQFAVNTYNALQAIYSRFDSIGQTNLSELENLIRGVQQTLSTSGLGFINNALSNISQLNSSILNQALETNSNVRSQAQQTRNFLQNTATGLRQSLEFTIGRGLSSTTQALSSELDTGLSQLSSELQQDTSQVLSAIEGEGDEQSNLIKDATKDVLGGILDIIGGVEDIKDDIQGIEIPGTDLIEPMLNRMGKVFLETLYELGEPILEFFRKYLQGEYDDFDEFRNDLETAFNGSSAALLPMIPFAAIQLGYQMINLLTYPSQISLTKMGNREVRPGLPTKEELQRYHFKGAAPREVIQNWAELLGLPNDQIDILLDRDIPNVPVDVLRELYLKGKIDRGTFIVRMAEYGFNGQQIDWIIESFETIPTPSDLVRMMVREVFSPEKRANFRLDEEYPEAFTGYMAQHGFKEQWAKDYWAAHWELPSLQMGYEMLHRGVITSEELDALMIAQDVMPIWRDRLKAISYSPFTRVDIRRMYKDDILTRNEVKTAYKDIGYNEDKAEKLTEWTVKQSIDRDGEDFKQLTRTSIVKALLSGIITREQAQTRLLEMGYTLADANILLDLGLMGQEGDTKLRRIEQANTRLAGNIINSYAAKNMDDGLAIQELIGLNYTQQEAETMIRIADETYDQALRDEYITRTKQMYMKYQITEGQLRLLLAQYQFSLPEIDKILFDVNALRDLRSGQLTEAQLRNSFEFGIIDEDELRDQLKGRGMSDKSIEIYLELYFGQDNEPVN